MKIFTRTRNDAPAPQQPEPEQSKTSVVLMRFLTAGGAVIELRPHRFATTYSRGGDLIYNKTSPRECEGFVWECLGCGIFGKGYIEYKARYLELELPSARGDANEHATVCRAMPRPGVRS